MSEQGYDTHPLIDFDALNSHKLSEEMITQEDYNAIMDEAYMELDKIVVAEKASNDRLLALLARIKGNKWVKDLMRLADDCCCYGMMGLSRRPGGNPQKESGFGEIKQIWVTQFQSSDLPDSHHGDIWVKIRDGRYVQLHFST